ncbi:hypothetical protein [Streptodolium elevatio]|uniref:Uncharacterized protein n=1 Tax=Streptodolium elevatio TaxID=3157996 RepID=A0ABV3DJW1_9ACTN
MAEMTRDEHVAVIRDFLKAADEVGNLDADEHLKKATVEALIYIGDQLGKLFERLGPPPVEAAPLWVPEHKGCYRRAGGWALILFDEPTPGREEIGWYLFGPGMGPNGYWTTTTLTGAQATANRVIEVYYANFTPERFGGQFEGDS